MRPSHRCNDPNWIPGPRSHWARQRRCSDIVLRFAEPHRAEMQQILNAMTDGQAKMVGRRQFRAHRRRNQARIIRFTPRYPIVTE